MFSEIIADLNQAKMPDPGDLARRFDFAMTKKLGIVKLPPAFWMKDPKINPRADHLFWAALLLKDRNRIELALSVLAVERSEKAGAKNNENSLGMVETILALVDQLMGQISDPVERRNLERNLREIIPEWTEGRLKDSR